MGEKLSEELSIICVKVVVEGKRKDKSAERCGVHDEEQRAENRPLGNATRGSVEGREDFITFNTKAAR